MSLDDIKENFGKEVAFLVDGVTKLSRLDYRHGKKTSSLNSMRKMFLAMAKDVRVVVIKLADRLHNMRTLRYMRSDITKAYCPGNAGNLCPPGTPLRYFQYQMGTGRLILPLSRTGINITISSTR